MSSSKFNFVLTQATTYKRDWKTLDELFEFQSSV